MASILVIEDRRGSHEVLRSALVIAGHDVVVSDTTDTAGRYDLALVDCSHASVTTVVGAARRHSSRVVLYSEKGTDQLSADATASGALGYIVRSKSPKTLLDEVQRFLKT